VPESAPFLVAEQLSLSRGGRQLFSNLCFKVGSGELIQVQGSNGAGKTSLMRILAGLSRYGFEGRVDRNEAILYLGHSSAVKGMLTPRENLSWSVTGRGQYSIEDIDRALSKVGLYGYEDVTSNTLSAGQHRRVNLARLHLSNCPLWLLDEPFTAIDKAGVEGLQALFGAHVENGGAIILTSHQTLSPGHRVRSINLDPAGSGVIA
jgi:heme exporter protein A